MRRTVTGLFSVLLFALAARQASAQDQIRDLVVKIHAVQHARIYSGRGRKIVLSRLKAPAWLSTADGFSPTPMW